MYGIVNVDGRSYDFSFTNISSFTNHDTWDRYFLVDLAWTSVVPPANDMDGDVIFVINGILYAGPRVRLGRDYIELAH